MEGERRTVREERSKKIKDGEKKISTDGRQVAVGK